ncbi:MAG: bifunctional 5,10-methylenetetrahydrofolate dehydrogenase/5,10-methenyltetrahydrofolate cyclohydrolase [Bacilli bacterium]|nr:bifunctional 5,10-methylenetetrahydrofolate dehydrogenase/5,10-methenyltetrahydrofolate cyclohydrolase [Bacilli bacterium]
MIVISGKEYREKNIPILKDKISKLGTKLGLCVIQVGNDEASTVYVKQKEKLALELGYKYVGKKFPETVNNEEVINYIKALNNDDSIDGIIVQMPLPSHLDTELIQNTIDPLKDVDGLTYLNTGKLVNNAPALVPCTPKGIIELLDAYNIDLDGMNACVIGRSILVGRPIVQLLTNRNATVTLCHSHTKDLASITRNADLVVVAVGKAGFLTADMVKDNAIIVDVGISRVNNKLYGDVDYENVSKKASYITPVPGGVGPMTVYELMNNVYEAHIMRKK